MFDPWTASLEEAQEEERKVLDERASGPHSPTMQCVAAKGIKERKQAVMDGNGFAVLSCIRSCVTHGLVAPDWLAYKFNQMYDAVGTCRADSWDDSKSFGRPYPKGKHLSRMRQDLVGRFQIWSAVYEAVRKDPETPIDKALFERIGKPLGFGATRTERLYYESLQMGLHNPAEFKKFAGLL